MSLKPLKENRWAEIDIDLLPYFREGLQEAVKRGYPADSNSGDYAVTGMNMDWELPGTFDASIQIRNLGLRAVVMFCENRNSTRRFAIYAPNISPR